MWASADDHIQYAGLYPLSGEALTALREYEAKKKLK